MVSGWEFDYCEEQQFASKIQSGSTKKRNTVQEVMLLSALLVMALIAQPLQGVRVPRDCRSRNIVQGAPFSDKIIEAHTESSKTR